MKRIKLLLIIMLVPASVWGQELKIEGKVIDGRTQDAVIGATVSLINGSSGVATGVDGRFSLAIASLPATVEVNYVGYKRQEIEVYDASEATVIRLDEDVNLLDEVIITGYIQQRRGVVTASVSNVKGREIEDVHGSSLDQKLQGKVPGMTVSSNSGAPGTSVSLRIRGTTSINAGNSPLYVVDGVFVNSEALQRIDNGGQVVNSLADLNPNDIESIEVLKDANATSIYGARGANGVIIITTKQGKLNARTSVSAGISLGVSKVRKLWHMVDGPQYAELTNEVFLNDGGDPAKIPYPNPAAEPSYIEEKLNDIFRTGLQQNHYVNVTGGDTKTRYYLGVDFNREVGTQKPDDLKRYSIRVNLDHKISERLKVGTNIGLSRVDRRISLNGNNTAAPVPSAIYPPANIPPRYPDGSYVSWAIHDSYLAMIHDLDNTSVSNRLIGALFAEWTIIRNLVLRSNWNIDYNTFDEDIYYPATTTTAAARGGSTTSARTKRQTLINEQTLRYGVSPRDAHNLSFLLGNTVQKNIQSWRSITAYGFPSDDFHEISSAATPSSVTGGGSQNGLLSFFGRAAYDFDGKYIADVNIRTDASSKFGANKKWGTFPSAGLAWNIRKESWFTARWISELKLRASYGITGNQNGIGNYSSYGLWSGGANYNGQSGLTPSQLANPELKWETTAQANFGIDGLFFDDRLQLEFNLYDKHTRDLLVSLPIAAISGFSSITKNAGEISNRGVEFAVTTTNIRKRKFEWTTSFNIAHNSNKVEKLDSPIDQYSWIRIEEGYPMFSFFAYKSLGVDKQTGDLIIDDYNGDGRITADDREHIGNALPLFSGGFGNTFKVGNFDADIFFSYSYGNDVLYMFQYMMQHGGTRPSWGYTTEQLQRWQKPGDETDVPRLTVMGNNYSLRNSRFMEDGSNIKLRSVSIGYNLPKSLLRPTGITAARIYATGTNLLIFTKYSGTDPEINVAGNSEQILGIDFATSPSPRTAVFGLNLTF
ncbi:MAG: TonB-dependent receptor [Tannerella sp.]|nr:TonB-dependent receptor [Tannerella sp.]